jgi:hypothetical protein
MTKSFGLIAYIWRGEFATAPASPAQNWVYRNTATKSVYMYDSGAWVLMVKDGIDGSSGKTPEFRMDGNTLQWKYTTDIAWTNLFTFPAYYTKAETDGLFDNHEKDETAHGIDEIKADIEDLKANGGGSAIAEAVTALLQAAYPKRI